MVNALFEVVSLKLVKSVGQGWTYYIFDFCMEFIPQAAFGCGVLVVLRKGSGFCGVRARSKLL